MTENGNREKRQRPRGGKLGGRDGARKAARSSGRTGRQIPLGAEFITTDRGAVQRILARGTKRVREVTANATVGVKDRGEFFIGRDGEIKQIENRVLRTVKATKASEGRTGIILMGAPGVGKTSLVDTARERLSESIETIELEPSHLQTPETFSDEMRARCGNRIRKLRSRLGEGALLAGAHSVDAIASIILGLGFTTSGWPVQPTDVQVHAAANTLKAWREGNPASISDVLRAIGWLYNDGLAIFIDEAQTLGDFLDHEDPRKSSAARIVQAIATPKGRQRAGVERMTGVFAGLSDTADVIGDLGSFGLKKIRLRPMEISDTQELTRREIARASGDRESSLSRAVEQVWLEPLTEMYGDWTRHAAGAAQAAREMVKGLQFNALTDPGGWAGVVTLADEVREEVYDDVRERAERHHVPQTIRDCLARALFCNGGSLSSTEARKLVGRVMTDTYDAEGVPSLTPEQHRQGVTNLIRRCKRSGILDSADKHHPSVPKEHLYCPVPSLISSLVNGATTDPKQLRRWLEECDLNSKEPKAEKHNRGRRKKGKKS